MPASHRDALEAFRALGRQDFSLLPIVWQGRALKRMGRLSEAIEVLTEGLRIRGATDESFRRAVAQLSSDGKGVMGMSDKKTY